MRKYPYLAQFFFVAVVVFTFGMLIGCEPAKSANGDGYVVPAISGKHHLRCRCNRHDGRGCVHWQCRRADRR